MASRLLERNRMSNRAPFWLSLLAVVAVAACDEEVSGITYVEDYGFCGDRCNSEIVLTPDGAGTLTIRKHRGDAVQLQRTFQLSILERHRIFALAANASSRDWEPRYGCPDCV